MSAEGQIKAFIDRILRLKEEQDVIGDDIRDIYAEAKGMGFDKTAMGNVVAHLRKVAKKGSETVAEQGAIFDIYLAAYEGHAPAPARVRENIEKFDPLTGEFLDDKIDPKLAHTIVTGLQTETGRAALIAAVDILIEQEETQEQNTDAAISRPELDRPEIENRSDEEATEADASGGMQDEIAIHPATSIASASQGEAEAHSDQRETDRKAAAIGVGANEGGDNVESSGLPAGLEGGPVNLEPTGPVAEWATEFADDGIRYEATPLRPMKSLPYAACFPELSHAHYQQLSDSIANSGVREPIVRMGDVIVDGWSRYNISRSLGIEYPVVSYLGNDVLLDVIAWQREARQFTPSQERQIAGRLAKEIPHRAADIMAAFSLTETAEREMA